MHLGGIALGVLLLLARLMRTKSFPALAAPTGICVALMVVLTAVSQFTVSERMATLRVRMGSIQATAADSPLLAEFSKLHRLSVMLESGVLLVGFAAMFLMVREFAAGR
jgi:hypothetical protein